MIAPGLALAEGGMRGAMGLAAALAVAVGSSAGGAPAPAGPAMPDPAASSAAAKGCRLFDRGAADLAAESCTTCHALHDSHPVDVDYEAARRPGRALRSAEEVTRRGVALPGGQVRCASCHDAGSPWKHRIALPPGAAARRAVNPHDASTYERPAASAARRAGQAARPSDALAAGAAVSPTPLCQACHTYGD